MCFGHDRDVVQVAVELLVVGRGAEVERHVVARRLDVREAARPQLMERRRGLLAGLERELDIGRGDGLAVAPRHAGANRRAIHVLLHPAALRGQPGRVLVRERVVVEQRLVDEANQPGHVVPRLERVEVAVGAPLRPGRVQGLAARERGCRGRRRGMCGRAADRRRNGDGADREHAQARRCPSPTDADHVETLLPAFQLDVAWRLVCCRAGGPAWNSMVLS